MNQPRLLQPILHVLQFEEDGDPDTTVEATPYPSAQSEPTWDRAPDTVRDGTGEGERHDSFIRIRARSSPYDIARFLDMLRDDQLNLMVDLVCLEHAVKELRRFDPVALATLRKPVADLADVRVALSDVLVERAPRGLIAPETPLGVYLKGLFVWTGNVIVALTELAANVCVGRPNWEQTVNRLQSASATHFDALVGDIRAELAERRANDPAAGSSLDELEARLAELFWAASWLQRTLQGLA